MNETKIEYKINGIDIEQTVIDNGMTQTISSRTKGKPTAAEINAEPAGRRMDKWVAEYVIKNRRKAEQYSRNNISALFLFEYAANSGDTDYTEWSLEYKHKSYDCHILVALGQDALLSRGIGDTMALAICRALLNLFCVGMA